MTDRKTVHRDEVIAHITANKDIIVIEDGFWVYWPTKESQGFLRPHDLRVIADHLDELNAPWEAQINKFFEEQE